MKKFLAGVGKALLFSGNDLIGVAETLTESTFNFSITSEDIRAGAGNALWGKYFHDSNLAVTLTDAMFDINYIAASLGTSVDVGGANAIAIKEEQVSVATAGQVTLSETPVAFNGAYIGWYKLPADDNWTIGTISGSTMIIADATVSDVYCVKYFYNNENAKSIIIPVQYVPATLHVVIINDLFSGDVANVGQASKIGRLITDIPRLQLDGSQDLSLNATSAATVSLSGNALAVTNTASCEDEGYYGTMTEEIAGASWTDDVVALAVENSVMELENSETETAIVRVIFGGNIASQRKDNSNFTFAVDSGSSATVGATTGVVTADDTTTGSTYISVTLKDADNNVVAVGYIEVIVSAGQ